MIIDSNDAAHCPWIKEAFPNATIQHLEIGDIAADDMSTIIERKTMDDLLCSVMDGRYKDQIRTLIDLPSFIIIVGRELSFHNRGKEKYVYGAINSMMYKYRLPVFIVGNNEAFIKKVKTIFEKRERIEDMNIVIKRRHNDPQLNLFCSIPGIGGKKAKILYERFDSIYNLCNATVEDIECIQGFGNKTANTIVKTLRNDII